MKFKLIIPAILVLAVAGGVLYKQEMSIKASRAEQEARVARLTPDAIQQPTPRVPAYSSVTPVKKSLPPTLSPEQFFGSAREGYTKVKEIPETIAQLPCYCHCDLHMGHKSLHSCFEDDHAANCSICLDEALLAYNLQKKSGLSPEQIRQRIIKQYGEMR
jgi:hypothetical protein